jgi:undecaprenyl-diphosphatase
VPEIREFLFALIREYGGLAIFFSLTLEYLGLPIPGESLMLLLGFLSVGKGTFMSATMATAGTFAGSFIAYAIGRRYGEDIIIRIGKPLHFTKERLDKTDRLLRSHEASTIILSRFIPGVRHIVPYLSGIARVEARRYSIFNLIGAAIWCTAFIFIGRITGSKWTEIGKFVGTYTLLALILIIFIFIVYKYFNRFKISILMLSASTIALILYALEMMENELSQFDNIIYGYLSIFITKDMTCLMKLISDMGSVYFLGSATAIILIVFWKRRKHWIYGIFATINLILVSLLNTIFKNIFHRPRPDILPLVHASGYSFPSGHSMISTAFYGYLIYLCIIFLKKPWKQIFSVFQIVLILFIGVSRIYLGVHYASDVIGGFLAGLSWLIIFITLTRLYLQKFKFGSNEKVGSQILKN